MAQAGVEILRAPSGGLNGDASPDYLAKEQAPLLENLLTGWPGKVIMRGPIRNGIALSTVDDELGALWTFDNKALTAHPDDGTYKLTDLAAMTTSSVGGTLAEFPISHVHTRYGDNVYGAIADANAPQLGLWDGGATPIIPQANAPFQFVDVRAHAKRMFVLGGTEPGTTTPVINSGRVLWYSDTPAGTVYPDLSALASWQDNISSPAVTNQIQYDGTDEPVALATVGRSLAILGSRSINILTGAGPSSFAIQNLSQDLGCTSRESVVETSTGFYMMTKRGYAFCDGTTITPLAEDRMLLGWTPWLSTDHSAAMLNNGYLALQIGTDYLQLMGLGSRTWSKVKATGVFNAGNSGNRSVHRSRDYPVFWDGKNLYLLDEVDSPTTLGGLVGDAAVGGTTQTIKPRWDSRVARLGQPTATATVRRVMLDYKAAYLTSGTTATSAGTVAVTDERGNVLGTFDLAPAMVSSAASAHRQRAALDVNGEADSIFLSVQMNVAPIVSPPTLATAVELYDAWVEYEGGQNRVSR
jgi:hypothetical protein